MHPDTYLHSREDMGYLIEDEILCRTVEIYAFVGVDPEAGLELAGTHHDQSRALLPRTWARSPVIKPVADTYQAVGA